MAALLACAASVEAGSKVALGTPASLLQAVLSENPGVTRAHTFVTGTAERIPAVVEDYYFENGALSMAGRAQESANSDFIMKGDAKEIYGWIVLKDRNAAFEYTTDAAGTVLVEEVPVEKIIPVCNFEAGVEALPGPVLESPNPRTPVPEPHIEPYAGQDLFKLQSLPGAKKVLWLDISRVMNGTKPLLFVKEEMYKTWQVFASSFSMFDVNVTTDPAIYQAAGLTNSGIGRLFNEPGRSFCSLNAFGTTRACTIQTQPAPMTHFMYGKTAAHEVGHLMGLSHDGSGSTEYYGGISNYQWSTIMGNNLCCKTWTTPAIQWSKGEYTGSNNKEDDLAIITRKLPFRQDDIPGAVPLKIGGDSVSALANRGQINNATDVDLFSFPIGPSGGRVSLVIDRTEIRGGSALDIDAKILDADQKVVGEANPTPLRSASFNNLNLPAGEYTLAIKGGSEGTPQNGFSNYASMGFYSIAGKISGAISTGIARNNGARGSVTLSPMRGDGRLNLGIPLHARVERITLVTAGGTTVFSSLGRVDAIDLAGQAAGNYLLSMAIDGVTVNRKVIRR